MVIEQLGRFMTLSGPKIKAPAQEVKILKVQKTGTMPE